MARNTTTPLFSLIDLAGKFVEQRKGIRAIALKSPARKDLNQVIVNPPGPKAFGLQATFE